MLGLDAVAAELSRRGAQAEIVHHGRGRRTIRALTARRVEIVVRTRRVGDWQTDSRLGEPDPPHDDDRFWVFVDLGAPARTFFVAPEWWVLEDIHRHHQRYLRSHGGVRAVTPGSTHHRIPSERIGRWVDRWDLLGL